MRLYKLLLPVSLAFFLSSFAMNVAYKLDTRETMLLKDTSTTKHLSERKETIPKGKTIGKKWMQETTDAPCRTASVN